MLFNKLLHICQCSFSEQCPRKSLAMGPLGPQAKACHQPRTRRRGEMPRPSHSPPWCLSPGGRRCPVACPARASPTVCPLLSWTCSAFQERSFMTILDFPNDAQGRGALPHQPGSPSLARAALGRRPRSRNSCTSTGRVGAAEGDGAGPGNIATPAQPPRRDRGKDVHGGGLGLGVWSALVRPEAVQE